jgi:hypothetical protein
MKMHLIAARCWEIVEVGVRTFDGYIWGLMAVNTFLLICRVTISNILTGLF